MISQKTYRREIDYNTIIASDDPGKEIQFLVMSATGSLEDKLIATAGAYYNSLTGDKIKDDYWAVKFVDFWYHRKGTDKFKLYAMLAGLWQLIEWEKDNALS